jgi:hypothetical protein
VLGLAEQLGGLAQAEAVGVAQENGEPLDVWQPIERGDQMGALDNLVDPGRVVRGDRLELIIGDRSP